MGCTPSVNASSQDETKQRQQSQPQPVQPVAVDVPKEEPPADVVEPSVDAPLGRETTVDLLMADPTPLPETQAITGDSASAEEKVTVTAAVAVSKVPEMESTIDVLMSDPNVERISLDPELLESLFVDESIDVEAELARLQQMINASAKDVRTLFDSVVADGEESVTRQRFVDFAESLDADVGGDAADDQYSQLCNYPDDEDGAIPMDLHRFAVGLVRLANLYVIQNEGNPMNSEVATQWDTFWTKKGERAVEAATSG